MNLRDQYHNLLKKYDLEITEDFGNISTVIKDSIHNFMNIHKRVAIYCYGGHTRALMIDYIFDLQNIVCIIDNGDIDEEQQGFVIIKDEEIESKKIDGVIISSYQYREEIKKSLKENHAGIDYLDFYDEMHQRGIVIDCDFFKFGTPYQNYIEINKIYQEIKKGIEIPDNMQKLVKKYIEVKDFRLASQMAKKFYDDYGNAEYQCLADDIADLYKRCLELLKMKGENAVLLMCIDGLKAEEFCAKGRLKKTYQAVKPRATIFTHAYSYSTSTYESLVPVFSENYNQHSNYMRYSDVPSTECRFAKFAKEQGRHIYVYGSGVKYIDDTEIKYIEHPQTITQMIWSFLTDMEFDSNGLFYMHPLYESHFTFPSPYYEDDMVVDGTSLFFDYLSTKGKKLRGKYSRQYDAAIRYIDDTLAPIFERILCRTLVFADHGNNHYEEFENQELKDMNPNVMIAAEELLRVPLAIISPDEGEINTSLISLSELNNIVLKMLRSEKFDYIGKPYIKIGRTAIYNPDYKYIYKQIFHCEHSLLAFEGFIFADGFKLLVFSDGTKELYTTKDDHMVQNDELTEKYYRIIENQLSIY